MIQTLQNLATHTIKVTERCKGLLLIQLLNQDVSTVLVKVDVVTKEVNRKNVIPLMKLTDYFQLINQYGELNNIKHVNATYKLPFSINGFLPFDDDNYYEVTLIFENPISLKYALYKDYVQGYPIRVVREEMKASLSEKEINCTSFDYILINSNFFDSYSFRKNDLLIEVDREEVYHNHYLNPQRNIGEEIVEEEDVINLFYAYPVIPINTLEAITLYSQQNDTDIELFKIDAA